MFYNLNPSDVDEEFIAIALHLRNNCTQFKNCHFLHWLGAVLANKKNNHLLTNMHNYFPHAYKYMTKNEWAYVTDLSEMWSEELVEYKRIKNLISLAPH